jgi:hypothetical protein
MLAIWCSGQSAGNYGTEATTLQSVVSEDYFSVAESFHQFLHVNVSML